MVLCQLVSFVIGCLFGLLQQWCACVCMHWHFNVLYFVFGNVALTKWHTWFMQVNELLWFLWWKQRPLSAPSVTRLVRVISQLRGNMLLVGIGGSGRQSLTRLAAYICKFTVFQVEVTKQYRKQEFREGEFYTQFITHIYSCSSWFCPERLSTLTVYILSLSFLGVEPWHWHC